VAGALAVLVMALGSPAAFGASNARSQWPVGATIVQESPLGPREGPAIAVRGSRVYVVGGVKTSHGVPLRRMTDGAIFDLRTRKWSRLPDVPFRRTQTSTAVWVGANLVVTGVVCPGRVGGEHACGDRMVAAVYSSRTKSWRRLKVPPRRRGYGLALMSTRTDAWFSDFLSTTALDLQTGRWRDIPPPLLGGSRSVCSAQRYAAVVGGIRPMGPAGLRLLTVDDDEWGPLVDPSGFPDAALGGAPACNEDSVIVVRGDLRAQSCATGTDCTTPPLKGSALARVLRYDLAARRWSEIAPPPPSRAGAFAVGHGGVVDYLGNGTPGLRLTTATGAWTAIAPGPVFAQAPGALVWARGLVVTHDRGELVIYRPV
jgi:hypothetical protein